VSVIIQGFEALDVRFPTSLGRHGSDAMHPDPDYSAAYVILRTDHPDGLEGHGLTFTLGRGNELCVAGIEALAPLVVGHSLEDIREDMAGFWRRLTSESQLRWVGPEKGVVHLATAALVNAVWDLWAKVEGKPLWRLLADMAPEELISCVDFRYITDMVTPEEALTLLRARQAGKADREAEMLRDGYPAYTTSVGWLGYEDGEIRRRCREAVAAGWTHFKVKVGGDPADDIRRCTLVREEIGPDRTLMLDANQRWDVGEAIRAMKDLARFQPLWIEEPTSPDDVLGHAAIARAIAPVRVATGEQCQNRVIFKQLLQADALGFCQIDACRLGGVNEVLAVRLPVRERVVGGPHRGVRGPPPRALRPPRGDPGRSLRGAHGGGLRHRDEGRVPRRVPFPGRPALEPGHRLTFGISAGGHPGTCPEVRGDDVRRVGRGLKEGPAVLSGSQDRG
jgi:L-fuconate dehydratase